MSSTDADVDPYELLDLKSESTEQEIRTAYRQRSLKVHPDRNPNNPDAARKFHELNQAYELLLDPLRRLALDATLRVKRARQERFKNYDNKRKNMVHELEERERALKKARMDKEKEEVDNWRATENIKEQGRMMREARERDIREREIGRQRATAMKNEESEAPPPLDSLDTTIRLKYKLTAHPNLTSPASLSSLLAPFGSTDTDSILLSQKAPKKAPNSPAKYGTAVVQFKQIGDAFAAVCASGRPERGLEGIDVGWAAGKEPQILGWLKKMGKLGTPLPPSNVDEEKNKPADRKAGLPQEQTSANPSTFSTFPESFPEIPIPSAVSNPSAPGIDYESLTLMRLRQAERDRLEREIREQEGDE